MKSKERAEWKYVRLGQAPFLCRGDRNPRRRLINVKETLSVLMLCAPSHPRQQFPYHMKMTDFDYFRVLSVFFVCV